ncbi:hypothetical protein LTR86_008465 [Recurvomyces mirabilis]|nr:hypothetical protein LTR86_008465 [Recurvomyces mirabilis]
MSTVQQPRDDRTVSRGNRTFAQFSLLNDVYCIPVDEAEASRLDELNGILGEVCGDRVVLPQVHFPPPGVDEPAVLDCGYGRGAWIDDLLEHYGAYECDITGVDLYLGDGAEDEDDDDDDDDDDADDSDAESVQEFVKKRWNLNARFSTDRSADRLRPESFDLINSRFLSEGIDTGRWASYVVDLKRLLKPGGWLQMIELEFLFQSHSGRLSLELTEPLRLWTEWYDTTMRQSNRDPRAGSRLRGHLDAAGFDEIQHYRRHLFVGSWNPSKNQVATAKSWQKLTILSFRITWTKHPR